MTDVNPLVIKVLALLATEKILGRARQLVDVKKEDGFSALHLAALNNHRDVAEILIKEVSPRPERSRTAFWEVHRFSQASERLFSQGRCDINIRNNRNQTPLQLAVTQGHTDLVQLLVAEGADVNMEDEDGDTAMHVALLRPQLAQHQHLLSSFIHPQLNASGLLGNTEISVGAAIACFLAQEGADINYANHKGKSPLDLVADGGTLQLLKSFSEKHRSSQMESEPSQGRSSGSLAGLGCPGQPFSMRSPWLLVSSDNSKKTGQNN
ncbi:unnamed protein product [Tetraodon nigroviridis]|uniref:(spotted green pufferfish) hypothetical protein n=1 Tax=Tetraodon nigroviridis TaxID=99883 RepID=Q4SC81_TETNG|nr:unnamed protein product [Tetraodon nigroviridis]